MYGNNSVLRQLTDARDEASNGIDTARDAISELENAVGELESFLDNIGSAIEALEDVDGLNVSVSLDSVEIDVSLYLS